jgi:hypothetical protein
VSSYPQVDPYSQLAYGSQPSYGGYPAASAYPTSPYDPYAQSYGGYPAASVYPGYSSSPYSSPSYDPYGSVSPYGISPYGYGDQSLLGGLNNLDDTNRNGIADHLEMTKSKIDDYLAKTQKLGKKKLSGDLTSWIKNYF